MKFIILGCGSSMGVPRSDGYFGKCNPKNKKNHRSRCSALIKTQTETILIDTSPDLRNQLIDNKIRKIYKGNTFLASEKSWKTEYLAPKVSIKSVKDVGDAINHINK